MEKKRSKHYSEVKSDTKESEMKKMPEKKCPHCNSPLRFRGPKNCVGAMYWKCRNKKCGRTLTIKKDFIGPAIPLVYNNKVRNF